MRIVVGWLLISYRNFPIADLFLVFQLQTLLHQEELHVNNFDFEPFKRSVLYVQELVKKPCFVVSGGRLVCL